jgi:hypothetical protein
VIDVTGRNPLQLTEFGERARDADWFDPAYSVSSAMREVLTWGWLKQMGSAR